MPNFSPAFFQEWGLGPLQETVFRMLIEHTPDFVSPYMFCEELYPEDENHLGMGAPDKLRVLVMSCRKVLVTHADDKISIFGFPRKGWFMTAADIEKMRNILAEG